jgi:hypothetical protein
MQTYTYGDAHARTHIRLHCQVPIKFMDREEGESKLTMKQNVECVFVCPFTHSLTHISLPLSFSIA